MRQIEEKRAKGEVGATSGYAVPFPDARSPHHAELEVHRLYRSAGTSAKVREVYGTNREAQRRGRFEN